MKPANTPTVASGAPAFKDMSHFPSMASRAVLGQQDLRELSNTTTARKAFLPQVGPLSCGLLNWIRMLVTQTIRSQHRSLVKHGQMQIACCGLMPEDVGHHILVEDRRHKMFLMLVLQTPATYIKSGCCQNLQHNGVMQASLVSA